MARPSIELIEKVAPSGPSDDVVSLSYELRQKTRQRVRLRSGREAAVMLPPGTPLLDGDRLRAADGTSVVVEAAAEPVTTARSSDPLQLARACYHLGNRHVALQVGEGWVRYQPDHVLDEMVVGLGLSIVHESACFEAERGAYGAAPHSHQHDGSHGSAPHAHHHHGSHGPESDQ